VIRQVCAFEQITIGELIKSEMLHLRGGDQLGYLAHIPIASHVMRDLREQLASLVEEGGLALVNAGTHPMAIWLNEPRSLYERYSQLEQAFQDVARSILIFALHIHIGIKSHQQAIALMDQLVTEAEIIAFCREHLAHFK
jgi:glutamate---cysteine ligase / carboxylate-amine ligase